MANIIIDLTKFPEGIHLTNGELSFVFETLKNLSDYFQRKDERHTGVEVLLLLLREKISSSLDAEELKLLEKVYNFIEILTGEKREKKLKIYEDGDL